MRLSLVMFFGKKPYGYKYRGKHRVVKEATLPQMLALRRDYERTEKNMLFLRHPYLTVEQSQGSSDLTKVDRHVQCIAKNVAARNKKFEKHVTLAERLVHLRVKEAWD